MNSKIPEYILACMAAAAVILFIVSTAYDAGKNQVNLTMWENPPNMESCVVYPDGGKKCKSAAVPEPISFTECARVCRGRVRMEKIK